MRPDEAENVSIGNKKSIQNRCKSEFWSVLVLKVIFGHAGCSSSRSGTTQMTSFGGVCEGAKGGRTSHTRLLNP